MNDVPVLDGIPTWYAAFRICR